MNRDSFYKHIYKYGDDYCIIRKNELYLSMLTIEEALFERDRLVAVDWDWELYCELPSTVNNYSYITLPPFDHKPKYISIDRERWTVVGKGKSYKYYGTYPNKDEAQKVALEHNGRIKHSPQRYMVQKTLGNKVVKFGKYKTLEEAEEKVLELLNNDWKN